LGTSGQDRWDLRSILATITYLKYKDDYLKPDFINTEYRYNGRNKSNKYL